MHYLSSVYFVNQPLHVSGIFVAHHQEVYRWTAVSTGNIFQDLPRLRKAADNTERYI